PRASTLFFFNDTPPPQIYTLSLHDALPILTLRLADAALAQVLHLLERLDPLGNEIQAHVAPERDEGVDDGGGMAFGSDRVDEHLDRKSTRLNSSHVEISYAVFCLKKKK